MSAALPIGAVALPAGKPQPLSERVTCLGNISLDQYGDNLLTYFAVDLGQLGEIFDLDPITEEERAAMLRGVSALLEEADVRGYGCRCSHDCCGHRFAQEPRILHIDPIYRVATVTQSSSLNI